MFIRKDTIRGGLFAAFTALAGIAAVAGTGGSTPHLPDALGTAAQKVVNATGGEPQAVAVMPADGANVTGYAAALLSVHLREEGLQARSVPWERRTDLPPGLPESVSHRLLALAGEEQATVLVACREPVDAEKWKLSVALYNSQTGKQKLLRTVPFTVPEDLSPLLSNHHNGLEGLERDWFRTMKKLFPALPRGGELPDRLHRTRVRFFFRRGLWKACAARLEEATAPDTDFLRRVIALKFSENGNAAADLLESTLAEHSESGPLHLLKAWTLRKEDPDRATKEIEKGRFEDMEREGYYRFARGLLELQREQYNKAEERFLNASDLLPEETFVQLKTARFYWNRAELESARKYFHRALDTGRKRAAIQAELGTVLAMAGKVDQAIEHLQAAAELNPWRPNVAKHLSSLFERRGQYSEAIQTLRRAAEANSQNPDFLCAYGDAAAHRWLLDEAISAYKQALRADPSFPYAKVRLARVLARQGDYKKARNLLIPLVEKDEQYVPAAVALGRVLTAEGRTNAAEQVLSNVAADSDAEVTRRLALSRLHLQTGKRSEAIRAAQVAVSIEKNARTYAALAEAFLAAGDVGKAETAAKQAKSANPYSARAHVMMARVSAEKEELEKALEQCKEALEMDPHEVDAMILRGNIHRRMGDAEKAASAWERALERDKWNESLHWRMAELLRKDLARPEKAIPHYRRVAELGGPRKDQAAQLAENLEADGETDG